MRDSFINISRAQNQISQRDTCIPALPTFHTASADVFLSATQDNNFHDMSVSQPSLDPVVASGKHIFVSRTGNVNLIRFIRYNRDSCI